MKKVLVVFFMIFIVATAWGQTSERFTSIVLIFDIRTSTETQIQNKLDSYMFRGYSIASTELYGDRLYVFLQAKF